MPATPDLLCSALAKRETPFQAVNDARHTTREESNMNQLVMVIDDSLVIRKIVETCLRRAGYHV